jgi:broad specificity phosphatase PhoE
MSVATLARCASLLIALCSGASVFADAADTEALELLAQPGHVLLLRHANAPGVGDPPEFDLSDCSTQRNLDDAGRAQARELGARLRAAGIKQARVYTSQWCRCRETARLLELGPVEELPALNSLFGHSNQRDSQVAALNAFLDKLPRDGSPIVLVSHQMTITALTGAFPSSGEGLVLKLQPGGAFKQVGALR